MTAPTPFELFQAGMAEGLLAAGARSFTEDDIRRRYLDWLEEQAAAGAQ